MTGELNPRSYASVRNRFLAMLLDALILVIPVSLGNHVIPVVGGVLVALFYAPVLESSELRGTIGKHLMTIQVADLGGNRISFGSAVLRYLVKVASSFCLFLGHFFAFFTEKKQALHDLVAGTVVIEGSGEGAIVDAWLTQLKTIFRMGESRPTLSELERLQALREKGAISEEEFQQEKKRILGSGR